MNIRIAVAVAAGAFLVATGVGFGLAARGSVSAESRAAAVAGAFFQSLNERRYPATCRLMSARFYRENHVPSRARCVLGLRIGFMWAPSVRYRIIGVQVDKGRAVVSAEANGAPGRIVLVEEAGVFKVLSVRGS